MCIQPNDPNMPLLGFFVKQIMYHEMGCLICEGILAKQVDMRNTMRARCFIPKLPVVDVPSFTIHARVLMDLSYCVESILTVAEEVKELMGKEVWLYFPLTQLLRINSLNLIPCYNLLRYACVLHP